MHQIVSPLKSQVKHTKSPIKSALRTGHPDNGPAEPPAARRICAQQVPWQPTAHSVGTRGQHQKHVSWSTTKWYRMCKGGLHYCYICFSTQKNRRSIVSETGAYRHTDKLWWASGYTGILFSDEPIQWTVAVSLLLFAHWVRLTKVEAMIPHKTDMLRYRTWLPIYEWLSQEPNYVRSGSGFRMNTASHYALFVVGSHQLLTIIW